MILGEMFADYVPAQQVMESGDTSDLRQVAIDFYESRGLLNPREIEISMLVVYMMLNYEASDE